MFDDIIVIGAGASGLMAARKLAAGGKRVRLIEARHEAGGRILTMPGGEFSQRIEAGAEFIHGNLPFTLSLLKEAGIAFHEINGQLWNARAGKPHHQKDLIGDQKLLVRKLNEVEEDISVREFLDLHFKDEKYSSLRQSITGYVQGYDLADLDKASTVALKNEWVKDDDDAQYRINEGYISLINYLKSDCEKYNCSFNFDTIINHIEWKAGAVTLTSNEGISFHCKKLLITVPIGVLQSGQQHRAHLHFSPGIPEKITAAHALGYGQVIKIILECRDLFWRDKKVVGRHSVKNLGFVFANTIIPTWWTQAPLETPIFTGWIGGPPARDNMHLNNESILQFAIDSLCSIFEIDHAVLVEMLVTWKIFNWATDDFSLGGYAYDSIGRQKHLNILLDPVADTIFFAGEGLALGTTIGTVEGALASGEDVAEKILRSY